MEGSPEESAASRNDGSISVHLQASLLIISRSDRRLWRPKAHSRAHHNCRSTTCVLWHKKAKQNVLKIRDQSSIRRHSFIITVVANVALARNGREEKLFGSSSFTCSSCIRSQVGRVSGLGVTCGSAWYYATLYDTVWAGESNARRHSGSFCDLHIDSLSASQ